jgi:hypothetical protein
VPDMLNRKKSVILSQREAFLVFGLPFLYDDAPFGRNRVGCTDVLLAVIRVPCSRTSMAEGRDFGPNSSR